MAWVGGNDGNAEFQLWHFARDQREGGESIDAEDLREPVGSKSVAVCALRVGNGILDLRIAASTVQPDTQAHARPRRWPHSLIVE